VTRSPLLDVRSRFGERSAVVQVTLGVLSALRRARGLLRRYGAPWPAARPCAADAPFLLLCLGVVSFSRTVMALRGPALGADRAAPRPPRGPAPAAVWAPQDLGR
jgi:hypothetical protein